MAKRFLGKYDGRKGAWLKAGKSFFALLVIVFIIFRVIIGVSWVNGESMCPTFHTGTAVAYFRPAGNFKVGDIVSVKMAYGEYYIKRVVAVGGDTVDIRDGVLYVNGSPEAGEWAHGETGTQSPNVVFPLTIPEGRMFVVGDNRPVSIDSRTFGPVAESQIRGRIFWHIG